MSAPGNLYATLAMAVPAPAERLSTLPIVIAVALRRAIVSVTKADHWALKWPNDILGAKGKVAGILIEIERRGDASIALIGCGVNCAHHPDSVRYTASNLNVEGFAVGPEELFQTLDGMIPMVLDAWGWGSAFEPLRREWSRHAPHLGRHISVRLEDGEVSGVATHIDEYGRLAVRTMDGTVLVSTGDVVMSSPENRQEHAPI